MRREFVLWLTLTVAAVNLGLLSFAVVLHNAQQKADQIVLKSPLVNMEQECITLKIFCPPCDPAGTVIGEETYCQKEGETRDEFLARVKKEHKEASETLCP